MQESETPTKDHLAENERVTIPNDLQQGYRRFWRITDRCLPLALGMIPVLVGPVVTRNFWKTGPLDFILFCPDAVLAKPSSHRSCRIFFFTNRRPRKHRWCSIGLDMRRRSCQQLYTTPTSRAPLSYADVLCYIELVWPSFAFFYFVSVSAYTHTNWSSAWQALVVPGSLSTTWILMASFSQAFSEGSRCLSVDTSRNSSQQSAVRARVDSWQT